MLVSQPAVDRWAYDVDHERRPACPGALKVGDVKLAVRKLRMLEHVYWSEDWEDAEIGEDMRIIVKQV